MQRTHVPSWFSDILPLEPRCEPAYDLQLLRRLIVANDVPLHQCTGSKCMKSCLHDFRQVCLWSLFGLQLSCNDLVISTMNSRLCCSQVQDLAICHPVVCLDKINLLQHYQLDPENLQGNLTKYWDYLQPSHQLFMAWFLHGTLKKTWHRTHIAFGHFQWILSIH